MKVKETLSIKLNGDERRLLRDTLDVAIHGCMAIMKNAEKDLNTSVYDAECEGTYLGAHRVSRVCGDGVDLLRSLFNQLD